MAASKENRTISQFKSRLAGGGARPNLFEVENSPSLESVQGFSLPGYDDTFKWRSCVRQQTCLHKTSLLLTFLSEVVSFKVAGDRTIDPWTITVINDEDFRLRRAI